MKRKQNNSALIATFTAALPKDDRAEARKMFGNPCCFVNGNMFTGLHKDKLVVRLDEARRKRLLREEGASIFEPMQGKPMKEYVTMPASMLSNKRRLRAWVQRAFEYGLSLPPKSKR